MALTESFLMLAKLGFLDVILPFALVFTLTYALFKKTNIFGRMSKRTSIIVALFTAFMFVGLFSFQNFMWMLFWMVLVFTAFLFYVLLIKTMGLETKVNGFVLGIVFAIFAFIGLYQFVDLDRFIRFVFNPFIITIILFFLMIWFIVYEKGDKKTKEEKKTDEMKEGKKEGEGKSKDNKDKKESQPEHKPKYDYPRVPPEEIPDYDFEEVERIPGDEFEKEFHKKYPPSGREY